MAEENNLVVFMAPHYNAIILRKSADTVTGGGLKPLTNATLNAA
jgi:hypothetical protein